MSAVVDWAFVRTGWTLPRVRKVGDVIVARSPVILGALTLGGSARTVMIDLKAHCVRIRDRRLWLIRYGRVLTFPQIAAVEYGYVDLNRAGDFVPFNSRQESDVYEVGLRLVSGESLLLFQFRGEGAWDNSGPLPDWMYPFDQAEAALTIGEQEQMSRLFAEVVSSRLGVPLTEVL
ncbi:MAG: hypothetical protein JST30_13125 [Armatimonadetes bacterium]|nr:hypothetical protein [Armatimonadota bacterium]